VQLVATAISSEAPGGVSLCLPAHNPTLWSSLLIELKNSSAEDPAGQSLPTGHLVTLSIAAFTWVPSTEVSGPTVKSLSGTPCGKVKH